MRKMSDGRVVCFGELLLRFSAPGHELLLQTPRLDVHVGGAEANVAVGLARLGRPAAMISAVPDNALGQAALGELRRHGVDVAGVQTLPGRMGLYFLSAGAVTRPFEVLYDRAASAFALAQPDLIDWDAALAGASWLHLSGVTPALGARAAEAAIRAAEGAVRLGVPVSFDGNYRAKLWAAWEGDGPAILRRLMAAADLPDVHDLRVGAHGVEHGLQRLVVVGEGSAVAALQPVQSRLQLHVQGGVGQLTRGELEDVLLALHQRTPSNQFCVRHS